VIGEDARMLHVGAQDRKAKRVARRQSHSGNEAAAGLLNVERQGP
jgi:hypothetical protein